MIERGISMTIDLAEIVYIIVEAVCNGLILAIFGKWLDKKIKKAERKEKTHEEIVDGFFEELAKLNKTLITTNHKIQLNRVSNALIIVKLLEESVLKQWVEIIAYYDTYKYDLKEFEECYNHMEKAWSEFTQQTTPEALVAKLQKFKEANQILMTKIRK